MRSFATTNGNDFLVKGGLLQIAVDINSCMDACKQAVLTLLGECEFDTTIGTDIKGTLWTGNPDLVRFNVSAKNQILRVPNVIGVVSFDSQVIGDKVSYNALIQTNFGIGALNGSI